MNHTTPAISAMRTPNRATVIATCDFFTGAAAGLGAGFGGAGIAEDAGGGLRIEEAGFAASFGGFTMPEAIGRFARGGTGRGRNVSGGTGGGGGFNAASGTSASTADSGRFSGESSSRPQSHCTNFAGRSGRNSASTAGTVGLTA